MNLDLTSLISAFVLGTSAIAVSVNSEKTKSKKKLKFKKVDKITIMKIF